MRHELAVGRGVDQSRAGCFLPRQVLRFGQELIRFHNGELSQATEVGLEPPDALLGIHHCVVVTEGRLEFHRQAVRDHTIARIPRVDSGTGLKNDAGSIGAQDVVVPVVPGRVGVGSGIAIKESEGRDGLEYRGPHRVVVDRRRHHCDEGFACCEFGRGDLFDVQGFTGIFVAGCSTSEHLLVGFVKRGSEVGVWNRHVTDLGVLLFDGTNDRLDIPSHDCSPYRPWPSVPSGSVTDAYASQDFLRQGKVPGLRVNRKPSPARGSRSRFTQPATGHRTTRPTPRQRCRRSSGWRACEPGAQRTGRPGRQPLRRPPR